MQNNLIQALVELNESTGENKWIEKAISFTDKMIDEFWSEKEGKFYDSGKSSTDTLVRPSTTGIETEETVRSYTGGSSLTLGLNYSF